MKSLERLNDVPSDGQWRSTGEMSERMGYRIHRSDELLALENLGYVEMEQHRTRKVNGWSYWWRRI